MADDEQDIEDDVESLDEEDEGKKGGKKKLIIILALILLLGGGAAGAYFMGYLDGVLGVETSEDGEHADDEHADGDDHGNDKKKAKKDDGHGGDAKGGGDTAFLALPPMTVNLNTEDGAPRFLRLTVQLELENPDEKADVEAVIPRVIDQFQTYLRELRVRDLRGSAGVYRLQMELLWRVNQAVEPIEIKDVLFQEILIQ